MTPSGESVSEDTREERANLRLAALHLRAAEVELAQASTYLGRTPRRGWWYQGNRYYHGAIELAELLEQSEPLEEAK